MSAVLSINTCWGQDEGAVKVDVWLRSLFLLVKCRTCHWRVKMEYCMLVNKEERPHRKSLTKHHKDTAIVSFLDTWVRVRYSVCKPPSTTGLLFFILSLAFITGVWFQSRPCTIFFFFSLQMVKMWWISLYKCFLNHQLPLCCAKMLSC